MKKVQMKHAQDITIILFSGQSFTFANGEPVDIPEVLVEELMKQGAGPVVTTELPVTKVASPKPTSAESRRKQIVDAVIMVVSENESSKLDSAGKPRVAAVSEAAGFKVNMDERDKAYATYLELGDDA